MDERRPIAENDQTTCVIEITAQDVNISEDIVSEQSHCGGHTSAPRRPQFLARRADVCETPGISLGRHSKGHLVSVLLFLKRRLSGVVHHPQLPGYLRYRLR
jgi:hypothetical protein